MASIPERVKSAFLIPGLSSQLIHQGKVRDSYQVPSYILLIFGIDDPARIICATDRISIFDFVLNALIPGKGEILTALTHFWLTRVLHEFPHHLLMSGRTGRNLAHYFRSKLNLNLPVERCLAVSETEIPPYEMIFRAHLGGSVWKKYQQTGMVAGIPLPAGMKKWQKLEPFLFTPSTKAEEGHDINIEQAEFFRAMGQAGRRAVENMLNAYFLAYHYARKRGVVILDTKFEGLKMIADEVLTPDSSRFTTSQDYEQALSENSDPVFYDKQVVRDWGSRVETPFQDPETGEKIVGINNLDAKDREHIAWVHSLEVPHKLIEVTSFRLHRIFELIVGDPLSSYQTENLF